MASALGIGAQVSLEIAKSNRDVLVRGTISSCPAEDVGLARIEDHPRPAPRYVIWTVDE
jgi:hypothetical protein